MPVLLVLVLAVLATLALAGRGVAAPVIETIEKPEVACIAGSLAPECLTTFAEEFPGTASGLLHAGGLLLDSVAASAIEARESIAAVPLPAAGWLLIVGFGGLGLFARRRQGALATLRRGDDGIEPVTTTLRGSARIDAPAPRSSRLDRRDPGLRDRLRALMFSGEGLRAFAPGHASPDRPCGGAGHRYPPTAGRAPPAAANGRAAGVIPLAPRHADGLYEWITSFTRLRGRISGLEARFLCAVATTILPDAGPSAGANCGALRQQQQERVKPSPPPVAPATRRAVVGRAVCPLEASVEGYL